MAYLILEPKELRAAGYDVEVDFLEGEGVRYRWVRDGDAGPWRTNRSAAWRKASEDYSFRLGLTWRHSAKLRDPDKAPTPHLRDRLLSLETIIAHGRPHHPSPEHGFRRVDPNET